jgi:hypothetical protein
MEKEMWIAEFGSRTRRGTNLGGIRDINIIPVINQLFPHISLFLNVACDESAIHKLA